MPAFQDKVMDITLVGGSSAGARAPLARTREDGVYLVLYQAVQRKRLVLPDGVADRKAFLEMLALPLPEKIVAVET